MKLSDTPRYTDHELLQLSGIQHFVFCPRQWGLMQLEQAWDDNHLTIEGSLLHKNVDNAFLREKRGSSVLTLRGIRLASQRLGISGIADAVEITPHEGAPAKKEEILKSKMYSAMPVEYKHGKSKISDCDRLQVTAQALILEEMWQINITKGAIFYWQQRQREYFEISENLRTVALDTISQMHSIVASQEIPIAVKTKKCKNCSMLDICLPALCNRSAKAYIAQSLSEL